VRQEEEVNTLLKQGGPFAIALLSCRIVGSRRDPDCFEPDRAPLGAIGVEPMNRSVVFVIAMAVFFGLVLPVGAQCIETERMEFAEEELIEGLFQDAAGREAAFILILPTSICLRGEDESDEVDDARTIQIYSSNEAVDASLRTFAGKRFASAVGHSVL
jgi:hypothetical protein